MSGRRWHQPKGRSGKESEAPSMVGPGVSISVGEQGIFGATEPPVARAGSPRRHSDVCARSGVRESQTDSS